MSISLSHRHSQLFSPYSLYVSQNDLKLKKQRSSGLLDSKAACTIYFIVNQDDHYASVDIKVTPFRLEADPDQIFHSAFACYRTCCAHAHANSFRKVLRATAQRVYASSFGFSSWDFSSDHCWKFAGYSPYLQTTTSCSDAALANIEALLSFNAPQSSPAKFVHNTEGGENASPILGKRVREALDNGSDILKRCRSTETGAHSDNGQSSKGSYEKPEDVLILARTLNEKDVEGFLQRTLRLECRALQMAHFCGYLSTSLQLLHAKSMGFGPKKTITKFRSIMKESGLAIARSTCQRRMLEARMVNTIIASMPSDLISSDCLTLIFQDKFYALVRSAARAESKVPDIVVIVTELHRTLSVAHRQAGTNSTDLLGFFKKRFPSLSDNDVREALGFHPKPTLTTFNIASNDCSTDVTRTLHTEPVRLGYPDPLLSLCEKPSNEQQEADVLEQTSIVEVGQQEETSAQSAFITDADVLNLSSFGVARDNCWVAGAPESLGVARENMWVLEAPELFGVERENQWHSATTGFYSEVTSLNLR